MPQIPARLGKLTVTDTNAVSLVLKLNHYENKNQFVSFINSRKAEAAFIGHIVVFFYNSKKLKCIGTLSFFKICSHIFMIFEENWSTDFGHAET